jgi:hypothetical protein
MIIALLVLIFFAILFPKALRFLFALLFIGAIAISAHAETKIICNPNSMVANGFFTHGSMVCNSHWLDRPASIAMAELSKRCRNLGEDELMSLAGFGAKDFDSYVIKIGRKSACKNLDKEMKLIDEATK